jgi:dTDP-4-dehydrorhamnose 3,5-epimerase
VSQPLTFADGPIAGVIVRPLTAYRDARGWLMELFRSDELAAAHCPAMAYVSETAAGVLRGPHEHARQTDLFGFVGPGEFAIYLWDARADSPTRGRRMKLHAGAAAPLCLIVPPGVVHAYRCVGATPGWVFNAPDRLYAGEGKRGPVDETRHEDRPDSPFRPW